MATRKIHTWLDQNQADLLDRLAKAVEIPSVSGSTEHIDDVKRMADFVVNQLTSVGVDAEKRFLGTHKLDNEEVDLPPVVLGSFGNDPNKKTLLVYGHYDVQPAHLEDGWNYDPFALTSDPDGSGRLYGRGSTDDKGPILGWINVLEAHKKLRLELPVNLRMVIEGMEESNSTGLARLIESEKDHFLSGIDCMCITDNHWLDNKTPCLTYGLRGICFMQIRVSGPEKDLHSGYFGGAVHEPMTDLITMLSKLVSPTGEITVPGLMDLVAPVTSDERKKFEAIISDIKDFQETAQGAATFSNDPIVTMMGRMRNPSLSIHGIVGDSYDKIVIPSPVTGTFSIRLVPNLSFKKTADLVVNHIQNEFKKSGSKNRCEVALQGGGEPWVTDPNHYSFRAAHKAIETVWGQSPNYTREGGTIPITLEFANILGVDICLLPVGRGDDGAHSTNEKIDISNYTNSAKVYAEYLYNLATAEA